MSAHERRWMVLWTALILGTTCLPYLAAWRLAPAGTRYTGLLINAYDGASYYAKMQQGARGDWLFHLPFTPEPHDGAFIFTFYLALGHLSATLNLPIPLTYHVARVIAGAFLLIVAYHLIARVFDTARSRRMAFLLLALSSGLGWLVAPLRTVTADLWVAEGFTFLALLANPHFPLAIGLMVVLVIGILDLSGSPAGPSRSGQAGRKVLIGAVTSVLLAVVQPFAIPIVLAVLAAYLAVLARQERRLPWVEGLFAGVVALAAAPVLAYDLAVYRSNPAFAAWAAQNLTPSLPPWDYALGYGLVLVLATAGMPAALRRRRPVDLLLVSWVAVAVVLLYVPFALQRRFITGLHVPLALLAALGVEQSIWPRLESRQRPSAAGLIVGFAALTNVFVMLVAVTGVAQGRPPLVMPAEEAAAWAWLRDNTAWTDTVLVPAGQGQFVPAWAGNRVVYGHPFETIEAEAKKEDVDRFYSPGTSQAERSAILARYGVCYVLASPQDLRMSPSQTENSPTLAPVWTDDTLALYRVESLP